MQLHPGRPPFHGIATALLRSTLEWMQRTGRASADGGDRDLVVALEREIARRAREGDPTGPPTTGDTPT